MYYTVSDIQKQLKIFHRSHGDIAKFLSTPELRHSYAENPHDVSRDPEVQHIISRFANLHSLLCIAESGGSDQEIKQKQQLYKGLKKQGLRGFALHATQLQIQRELQIRNAALSDGGASIGRVAAAGRQGNGGRKAHAGGQKKAESGDSDGGGDGDGGSEPPRPPQHLSLPQYNTPQHPYSELVAVPDLSHFLKVGEQHIRNMLCAGKLPGALKIPGVRGPRWPLEIYDYLCGQATPYQPDPVGRHKPPAPAAKRGRGRPRIAARGQAVQS
ncbi:MAG: hypothetical protein M0Z50_19170 [Planctomycetia bacterium]|nr:hypothetical protein [Planctomycetia bacterium]